MDCLNCGKKLNLKHDGCVCKHCGYYNRQAETGNDFSMEQKASFREITHEDISKGKTTSLTHEHKEAQPTRVGRNSQYSASEIVASKKFVKGFAIVFFVFMVSSMLLTIVPFIMMNLSMNHLFDEDNSLQTSTVVYDDQTIEDNYDLYSGNDVVDFKNGGTLKTYEASEVTISGYPLADRYKLIRVPYEFSQSDGVYDSENLEIYVDTMDGDYGYLIYGDELIDYMSEDIYTQYSPYQDVFGQSGHFFFMVPEDSDKGYVYIIETIGDSFELHQMYKEW